LIRGRAVEYCSEFDSLRIRQDGQTGGNRSGYFNDKGRIVGTAITAARTKNGGFSGGNFRTASVLAPHKVKAKRVDGGVLIEEGSWSFNSGVYHAQWDILSIPIFDESGQFIDSGSALIPISQVTLLHDWDTIGLRGSGSTSVAVKDLFITYDRLSVFRRRDTGSHGVAGRHARHDGSIGNPQVFDSIDFEVGVYDRHGNHGPSWRYTSDASR
jgi:hypothetical protein